MLSSITNDIACIERSNNTIDAHVECSMFRMIQDNKDLMIITKALQNENLFSENNEHVRKIMNGKIIHNKIIETTVNMYEDGLKVMYLFIKERYINHSVDIDHRLPAMPRFKLSDLYVPDEQKIKKKIDKNAIVNKIIKGADSLIKDIISLSFFRVCIGHINHSQRSSFLISNFFS
jgi:hypothetical protein